MLEKIKEKIKNDVTRGKIEEVIEFYANKHTSQRARADNLIRIKLKGRQRFRSTKTIETN